MPVRGAIAGKLLLLLLLFAAACGHAAGLYTGQVPVPSQSDADRAEALKNALAQVVIRVSGDPGVLSKPDLAKAVAGAERYVQQFQYQQDVVNDAGGQPQIRLTLVAQFDRDAVDQLLRDHGAGQEAPRDAQAAPVETAPATYRLWVGGMHSAVDYARVVGAFSASEFVRDLQVASARGDGAELRVTAVASLSRLLDAMNAGAVVRVTNAKPPVDGIDALLDLRQ